MAALNTLIFMLISCFLYENTPIQHPKVDDIVIQLLETEDIVPCLITVKSTINFTGYNKKWTKDYKGEYIFQKLKEDALQNRQSILSYLDGHDIAYHNYIITNGIYAELNVALGHNSTFLSPGAPKIRPQNLASSLWL